MAGEQRYNPGLLSGEVDPTRNRFEAPPSDPFGGYTDLFAEIEAEFAEEEESPSFLGATAQGRVFDWVTSVGGRFIKNLPISGRNTLNALEYASTQEDLVNLATAVEAAEERLEKIEAGTDTGPETVPMGFLAGASPSMLALAGEPAERMKPSDRIVQRVQAGESIEEVISATMDKSQMVLDRVKERVYKNSARAPRESAALMDMLETDTGLIDTLREGSELFTEEEFAGIVDVVAGSAIPSLIIGVTGVVGGLATGTVAGAVTRSPRVGAAAGRAGAGFAAGFTSAAFEARYALMEYMLDEGVDVTNARAIFDFARKNPEKLIEIAEDTRNRAAMVGGFDGIATATGGMAGQAIAAPAKAVAGSAFRVAAKTTARVVTGTLAELNLQGLLGASGVIAANLMNGERLNYDEAFLEYLGELAMGGAGEAGVGLLTGRIGAAAAGTPPATGTPPPAGTAPRTGASSPQTTAPTSLKPFEAQSILDVINMEGLTEAEKFAKVKGIFREVEARQQEEFGDTSKAQPAKADPITGETAPPPTPLEREGVSEEEALASANKKLQQEEPPTLDPNLPTGEQDLLGVAEATIAARKAEKPAREDALAGIDLSNNARFVPTATVLEQVGNRILTTSTSGKTFGVLEIGEDNTVISSSSFRNEENARAALAGEAVEPALGPETTAGPTPQSNVPERAEAAAERLAEAAEAITPEDLVEEDVFTEADLDVPPSIEEDIELVRSELARGRLDAYREVIAEGAAFEDVRAALAAENPDVGITEDMDLQDIVDALADRDVNTTPPEEVSKLAEELRARSAEELAAEELVETEGEIAPEEGAVSLEAVEREIAEDTSPTQAEDITAEEEDMASALLDAVTDPEDRIPVEDDLDRIGRAVATPESPTEPAIKPRRNRVRQDLISDLRTVRNTGSGIATDRVEDGRRITELTKPELAEEFQQAVANRFRNFDEDSDQAELLRRLNTARPPALQAKDAAEDTTNVKNQRTYWQIEGIDDDQNLLVVRRRLDNPDAFAMYTYNPYTRETQFVTAQGGMTASQKRRLEGLRSFKGIFQAVRAMSEAVLKEYEAFVTPDKDFAGGGRKRLEGTTPVLTVEQIMSRRERDAQRRAAGITELENRVAKLKEQFEALSLKEDPDLVRQQGEELRFARRQLLRRQEEEARRPTLEEERARVEAAAPEYEALFRATETEEVSDASEIVPETRATKGKDVRTLMRTADIEAVKNSETSSALAIQILPSGGSRFIRFRAGDGTRNNPENEYVISVEGEAVVQPSGTELGPIDLVTPEVIGTLPADPEKIAAAREREAIAREERDAGMLSRGIGPGARKTIRGATPLQVAQEQVAELQDEYLKLDDEIMEKNLEYQDLLAQDRMPEAEVASAQLEKLRERSAILREQLGEEMAAVERRKQAKKDSGITQKQKDFLKKRLENARDALEDWILKNRKTFNKTLSERNELTKKNVRGKGLSKAERARLKTLNEKVRMMSAARAQLASKVKAAAIDEGDANRFEINRNENRFTKVPGVPKEVIREFLGNQTRVSNDVLIISPTDDRLLEAEKGGAEITIDDYEVFVNPESYTALFGEIGRILQERTSAPGEGRADFSGRDLSALEKQPLVQRSLDTLQDTWDFFYNVFDARQEPHLWNTLSNIIARFPDTTWIQRVATAEQLRNIAKYSEIPSSGNKQVVAERIATHVNALREAQNEEEAVAPITTARDELAEWYSAYKPDLSEESEAAVAYLERFRRQARDNGWSEDAIAQAVRAMVNERADMSAAGQRAFATVTEIIERHADLYTSRSFRTEEEFADLAQRDVEYEDELANELQAMESAAALRKLIKNPATTLGASLRDAIEAALDLPAAQSRAIIKLYEDVHQFRRTPRFLQTRAERAEPAPAESPIDREMALLEAEIAGQDRPLLTLPEGVRPRNREGIDLDQVARQARETTRRRPASAMARAFEDATVDPDVEEVVQANPTVPTTRDLTPEEEQRVVDNDLQKMEDTLSEGEAKVRPEDSVIFDPNIGILGGAPIMSASQQLKFIARKVAAFTKPPVIGNLLNYGNSKNTAAAKNLKAALEREYRSAKGEALLPYLKIKELGVQLTDALERAGLYGTPEDIANTNRAITFYIESGYNLPNTRAAFGGINLPNNVLNIIHEQNAIKADLSMQYARRSIGKTWMKRKASQRGATYLHKQSSFEHGFLQEFVTGRKQKRFKDIDPDEAAALISDAADYFDLTLTPAVLNSMTLEELRKELKSNGLFAGVVTKHELKPDTQAVLAFPDANGKYLAVEKADRSDILDFINRTQSTPEWQAAKDRTFRNTIEAQFDQIASFDNLFANNNVAYSPTAGDASISRSRNVFLSEADRIDALYRVLVRRQNETKDPTTLPFIKQLRKLKRGAWDHVRQMTSQQFLQYLQSHQAQFNITPKTQEQLKRAELEWKINTRIRKALGEVTDPTALLSDTARRIADEMEFSKFMDKAITLGLNQGLVSIGEKEAGHVPLSKYDPAFGEEFGIPALAQVEYRIPTTAGRVEVEEGGQPRIFADPAYRDAIHDLLGVTTVKSSGRLMNLLRALTGLSKIDKVVGNPTSHPRNAASTGMIGLFRGMYTFNFPTFDGTGPFAASARIGIRQAAAPFSQKAELWATKSIQQDAFLSGLWEQVVKKGLMYDGGKSGAFMDIFSHISSLNAEDALHLMSGNTWVTTQGQTQRSGTVGKATEAASVGVERVKSVAQEWFRLEDEVAKIAGFLTRSQQFAEMIEAYDDAGNPLIHDGREAINEYLSNPNWGSPQQRVILDMAMDMAAQNVAETIPTFSRAPRWVKTISRNGVAGAFPTFNWLMIANTFAHAAFIAKLWRGIGPGGVKLNRGKAVYLGNKLAALMSINLALQVLALPAMNKIASNTIKDRGPGEDEDADEDAIAQIMGQFLLHNRNADEFRKFLPEWHEGTSFSVIPGSIGEGGFDWVNWGYTAAEGGPLEALYASINNLRNVANDPNLSDANYLEMTYRSLAGAASPWVNLFGGQEVLFGETIERINEPTDPDQGFEDAWVKNFGDVANQWIRQRVGDINDDPDGELARFVAGLGSSVVANVPPNMFARKVEEGVRATIDAKVGEKEWSDYAQSGLFTGFGIKTDRFTVKDDYPAQWYFTDRPRLTEARRNIVDLFNPDIKYSGYEEFRSMYNQAEAIRRQEFDTVHQNFMRMRAMGATEEDIREALAAGSMAKEPSSAGGFEIDDLFAGRYTPLNLRDTDSKMQEYRAAFDKENSRTEYNTRWRWLGRAQDEYDRD